MRVRYEVISGFDPKLVYSIIGEKEKDGIVTALVVFKGEFTVGELVKLQKERLMYN